jgi:hypothetical protein
VILRHQRGYVGVLSGEKVDVITRKLQKLEGKKKPKNKMETLDSLINNVLKILIHWFGIGEIF